MTITIATPVAPQENQQPVQTVNFEVKYLSPSSLKPYYRNSKRHDRRQITLLAKALKISGFDQPIVVDKDLVIIKGHGRRLASLEIKLDLVPVVIRDDLTDEEVMASRIADNVSQSMSDVDKTKEQQEISNYVDNGGTEATIFFDFMNAPTQKIIEVPGAATPAPKKTVTVAGNLETCPKCGNTFMEIKK